MLPEDLRIPSITRYKDPVTFARSFVGLEKKLGTAINIPGPEAPDEERREFFSKLGVPDSADKYSFNVREIVDKTLGKDYPVNEPFVNAMRAAFHAEGVPDKTAAKLVELYVGQQKAAQEFIQAEVDKGVEEIKSEWGHAYESKVALATRAVQSLAADCPRLVKFFEDPRNGSNPAILELMAYLGGAMAEDTALSGDEKISPSDAKGIRGEIEAMLNNPKHPDYEALRSADHPMHKKAVEKKDALYKQLYPEGDKAA